MEKETGLVKSVIKLVNDITALGIAALALIALIVALLKFG